MNKMNPESSRIRRRRLRCARCGGDDVNTSYRTEVVPFGAGTDAVHLHVSVPVRNCATCETMFTDREAEIVRHEAVCRHLRVLTPREIRGLRLRLGMTRRQFAALTRLGE